jgi:hypothetical protein
VALLIEDVVEIPSPPKGGEVRERGQNEAAKFFER